MYPQYLFEYPNVGTDFPFYMKHKSYTGVPLHRHDFIEFSFVLGGRGTERINGTEHEMLPGTVVLLLPYQIHEYRAAAGETLQMYICNFDMKLLTAGPESAWGLQKLLLAGDDAGPAHILLQGPAFEEGLRLWQRLYREYGSTLAWRPIVLRALLLEALALFVRAGGKGATVPERVEADKQMNAPTAKNVWTVIQYVYDHYLDPLSLSLLADRFHIHAAQLSTQISETLGIHFVDFLHELRVRHACSLLISSDLPIVQVAYESGFSSYPTFSRIFHRIKRTTPRDYRAEQQRRR